MHLKLTLLILCALSASALNVLAENKIVTSSTAESNQTYNDSDLTLSALNVTTNGVTYSGTNITLSATNNGGSTDAIGNGAYINNGAHLSLTNGSITTTGVNGDGVYITIRSSGTLNNVNIKTGGNVGHGVYAGGTSALTMTGGTVSTTADSSGCGVYLYYGSNGTLNNVNIKTEGTFSYGVYATLRSLLTMTGGTVSTTGSNGYGAYLSSSSGTLNNVNIKTEGNAGHGVSLFTSTLTMTNSDISATGNNAYAINVASRSTATVNLNHNTITGNILASGTSTLTLSGSNGTVLTGNVTGTTGGTIGITLTGEDTALHGNINQSGATINLTVGADALFEGGGELDNLTLESSALLGYTDGLTVTTSITIGDNITIDFSSLTETDNYLVLDWTGASGGDAISGDQFIIAGTGVEGTFSVTNNQLYFNATAVPEPSTWFLLGAALGVLALIRRQTK
ncbi:MAG: PEP-CTERM sorting domain-containing protein [Verrucomicrobiales bacterium]|jgi:hypothetical protein|nr:PEP-CTERM sorting domain-containing protein [Verrucomicrobiales bacterium]